MRDEQLVEERVTVSVRTVPAADSAETRSDIDWFKAEAQTIDCDGADIARWHWQKIFAALHRDERAAGN